MRKDFEEWAKSLPMANLKRHLSGYENAQINSYWSVWQASRQSLAVKLPRVTGDAVYDAQEVLDALDAAGVRYE